MSEQFFSTSNKTGGTNTSGYKLETGDPRHFDISWTLELKSQDFMVTHVHANLYGCLSLNRDEALALQIELNRWLLLSPEPEEKRT